MNRIFPYIAVFTLMMLWLSFPAQARNAEDVLSIELSSDHVGISTGFNGATFSVFGHNRVDGDVAIVIQGPLHSFVVRRKDQVAGIWMNKQSMRFVRIPVYYDVATTKALPELASIDVLRDYSIGLDVLNLQHRGSKKEQAVAKFKEALVRGKQQEGNYPLEPRQIEFLSDNFFRADFKVPANVPTGEYRVRAFLFKDGALIDQEEKQLQVAQVGLGASVYTMAYTQSFLYGFMAIFFALFAGGSAYYVMRR